MVSENLQGPADYVMQCDGTTQTEWAGGLEVAPFGFFSIGQSSLESDSNFQGALLHSDVYCDFGRRIQSFTCGMDYEIVTLHRKSSSERLGLTFSTSFSKESRKHFFINQIEEGSVADNDGRLQEGDHILQGDGDTVENESYYVEKDSGVRRTDESTKCDESSGAETKESEYLVYKTRTSEDNLCLDSLEEPNLGEKKIQSPRMSFNEVCWYKYDKPCRLFSRSV
ncbi:uncharacterized protein LOC143256373 isoform X3 [Tachypleus tridentatus]|uniref:uncharacterized protein LOC143256373 isoform X3 n=1 Tax=Tachypleus tridentatus TaxID=6853 RepID=UPI003FCFB00F